MWHFRCTSVFRAVKVLLLLNAYLASLILSNELLAQQENLGLDNAITPPEEIVVNPDIRFTKLKSEVLKAEKKVFAIFNEINDDDDFDVICTLEKLPGSRMKNHVCRPAYYWIARQEEGQRMQASVAAMAVYGGNGPYNPYISTDPGQGTGQGRGRGVAILKPYNDQMEGKLREAIEKSQDLVDAIMEYDSINLRYQERMDK